MCAINIPQQKRFSFSPVFLKRTSQKLPAAATVEAACIFPLVLFFFLSVIWFIDLYYIHSRVGAVVNSAGNEMVAYSYPYYLVMEKGHEEDSSVFSKAVKIGWNEGVIKSRIQKLPEYSKISSLTTLLSDVTNEDEIDILVTYCVKPFIDIPGISGVILTNHFYSKAYTGYAGKDTSEDEMVYITRTGEVYHTSLDCQALKCDPYPVLLSGIGNERNIGGAIYYPCETCKKKGFSETVYVTPHGNRYHSSEKCSKLKVDIFQIPFSEAGGRGLCKFCKKRSAK